MVQSSNGRSKPGARQQRRSEARRAAILTAAARVFQEMGFAAAGMRDIAVAADLSPANLYYYFGGKDEILYFCQNRALDRLLANAATASHGKGPIAARLRILATEHVRCLIEDVRGSAAHFELDALPARRRAAVVARRDRYERVVRALVAAGIRRGELAQTDASVATRAFLGALNWTVQWFRPHGPIPARHIAELVAGYAVGGLEQNRVQSSTHAHRQRRAVRRRIRSLQDVARGAA